MEYKINTPKLPEIRCLYALWIHDRVYVGATTNLRKRMANHRSKSKRSIKWLYRAMRKCGLDNVRLEFKEITDEYAMLFEEEGKLIKEMYDKGVKMFNYNYIDEIGILRRLKDD